MNKWVKNKLIPGSSQHVHSTCASPVTAEVMYSGKLVKIPSTQILGPSELHLERRKW